MEHLIENANEVLRNRKIKFIRYMTKQEANGMGWYKRPIVMVLDNGTMIYLSSDDEGNDGGSLFYQTKEKQPDGKFTIVDGVIPTI